MKYRRNEKKTNSLQTVAILISGDYLYLNVVHIYNVGYI